MAAHAYSLLDSYTYGFALTKMNLPFDTSDEVAEVAQSMLRPFPLAEFSHLTEMIVEHAVKPGYDHGDEFERVRGQGLISRQVVKLAPRPRHQRVKGQRDFFLSGRVISPPPGGSGPAGTPAAMMPVPRAAGRLPVGRNVLRLEELGHPDIRALAPEPALLETPKGGSRVGDEAAIQPDHPGVKGFGDGEPPR